MLTRSLVAAEDKLAVLFVLQRIRPGATGARLHTELPRTLRDRWTVNYLTDIVLRELIRENHAFARQVGPSLVHYFITQQGKTYASSA